MRNGPAPPEKGAAVPSTESRKLSDASVRSRSFAERGRPALRPRAGAPGTGRGGRFGPLLSGRFSPASAADISSLPAGCEPLCFGPGRRTVSRPAFGWMQPRVRGGYFRLCAPPASRWSRRGTVGTKYQTRPRTENTPAPPTPPAPDNHPPNNNHHKKPTPKTSPPTAPNTKNHKVLSLFFRVLRKNFRKPGARPPTQHNAFPNEKLGGRHKRGLGEDLDPAKNGNAPLDQRRQLRQPPTQRPLLPPSPKTPHLPTPNAKETFRALAKKIFRPGAPPAHPT